MLLIADLKLAFKESDLLVIETVLVSVCRDEDLKGCKTAAKGKNSTLSSF